MKRVLVFACLILLCASCAALASEDNWRIVIKADDGAGGGGFGTQVGVGTPSNPPDFVVNYSLVTGPAVVSVFPPYTTTRDILPPADPPRVWELRVASTTFAPITRLTFTTLSGTTLPPGVVHGIPVFYEMVMVDNRGVAGAPENGTKWNVPIPTAHSSIAYYTLPSLPTIVLSSPSGAAMIAEGYVMEFRQSVVPEPSSLLALGSGMLGLAGFALRRKR